MVNEAVECGVECGAELIQIICKSIQEYGPEIIDSLSELTDKQKKKLQEFLDKKAQHIYQNTDEIYTQVMNPNYRYKLITQDILNDSMHILSRRNVGTPSLKARIMDKLLRKVGLGQCSSRRSVSRSVQKIKKEKDVYTVPTNSTRRVSNFSKGSGS